MGYQERDYYRGDTPGNGYISSVVVKLIIINAVVFLADLFFSVDHNIAQTLSVQGDTIVRPWMWWQFLTSGFVHNAQNPWHIVGNMIGLYCFGKPLEERLGWKEFLRFYLIAIILGAVFWSARTYFLVGPVKYLMGGEEVVLWGRAMGASGGVTAAIILFCLYYPRATIMLFMAIPAPAWVAGLLLIGLDVFGVAPMGGDFRVAHDIHLVGAAMALGYWYFGLNFGRLPGLDSLGRVTKKISRSLKPKPDLRVHDPEAVYENLDAEADRVLEKIAREGESSLTARERRTLEDYSRRMRQKLR